MDGDLERRVEELTERVARLERELRLRGSPFANRSLRSQATGDKPSTIERSEPTLTPGSVQEPAPDPAPVAAANLLPEASERSERPGEGESLELVVGANWLNRIGVVTIVIGIALAVGYTVGHTGALGRVAIGYAMSFVLLGAGGWLERKPMYRSYAYGLVAGGWGAIYFTTYAMHAVEAARVIESDLVGTAALVLVAAGMVVHSLKYRSQTVTGLAYLIGYATLALTPLSGFALVASVPLSASLLYVAGRFGWAKMATVGLVSTYGVFVARQGTTILPGEAVPGLLAPYLTLGAYWLTFEIGDIRALRHRRSDAGEPAPLFSLNAIAFVGALLLQLPPDAPEWFPGVLAGASAAYLSSAFVRARLLGPVGRATDAASALTGAPQGAVGVATGLAVWAMLLRFSGSREVIALLLTAEILFVSGVMFGDRIIRAFGAAVSILVVMRALPLIQLERGTVPWPWAMHAWTPVLVLVALAFYVNREVLRARQLQPMSVEHGYAAVASILLVQVISGEVALRYLGLAFVLAASLLLEVGLRRVAEYRYHAYAIGAIGLMVTARVHEQWTLVGVVALCYAGAARLGATSRGQPGIDEIRYGAAGAACAGTVMLVLLEHETAPVALIGPIWAATALGLVCAGVLRRVPLFVMQGHLLVLAAAARAMARVEMAPMREAGPDALWAIVVVAASIAAGLIGRRSLVVPGSQASRLPGSLADIEEGLRIVTLIGAATSVVLLILHEVEASAVTLALGLAGAALVGGGVPLGERALRLSGLAVFALAILKLFVNDLVSLEGLTRIVSFIVSGTALLTVSWAYTRFRDQIRRYL